MIFVQALVVGISDILVPFKKQKSFIFGWKPLQKSETVREVYQYNGLV